MWQDAFTAFALYLVIEGMIPFIGPNRFRQAVAQRADGGAPEELETEFGDLLFALVQLARWQGIDAEGALRRATRKFIHRFRWMEDAIRARGLQHDQQTPSRWWALWAQAKANAK